MVALAITFVVAGGVWFTTTLLRVVPNVPSTADSSPVATIEPLSALASITYTDARIGFTLEYPSAYRIVTDSAFENRLGRRVMLDLRQEYSDRSEHTPFSEDQPLPSNIEIMVDSYGAHPKSDQEFIAATCDNVQGDILGRQWTVNSAPAWECFHAFGGDGGGEVYELYLRQTPLWFRFRYVAPSLGAFTLNRRAVLFRIAESVRTN